MIEENNALVDGTSIDSTIKDLANQVLAEQDADKTKDLIRLFNWNLSKKNVLRVQKLQGLYDSVTDLMIERVAKKSDQFTNSDLLDYLKTIQGAVDSSTKNLSQVEELPTIVQNNNTVNVTVVDQFDRDSKERILAAIQATLKAANNPPKPDVEIIIDETPNTTEERKVTETDE